MGHLHFQHYPRKPRTIFSILTTTHKIIHLNSSRNQLNSIWPKRRRIWTHFWFQQWRYDMSICPILSSNLRYFYKNSIFFGAFPNPYVGELHIMNFIIKTLPSVFYKSKYLAHDSDYHEFIMKKSSTTNTSPLHMTGITPYPLC